MISETSARIITNWVANQLRERDRDQVIGLEFPTNVFGLNFGGFIELKGMAKKVRFTVYLIASTEEEKIRELDTLLRSIKLSGETRWVLGQLERRTFSAFST